MYNTDYGRQVFGVVSFESLVFKDGIPIYQQIVWYIKEGIASGQINNGDELPSRRVLSALLSVNPNTIQKAYRLIEDEGLIESHTGAKSCVSVSGERINQLRAEMLNIRVTEIVAGFKQMGVNKEEALALIESMWEANGNE